MRRLLFHMRIRAVLLFMNTRIRLMPTSQLLCLVHVMHHLHITALHMVRLLNLMQDLLFRWAIARPLHRLFQVKIVLPLLQYASA
jgi:hypothetical protein